MEKEKNSQLELFSQGQKGRSEIKSCARARRPDFSFFNYIRNYEKVILIIIGMVITGIFSFSLGVERGKYLVQKYQNVPGVTQSESIVAPKTQAQPVTSEESLRYNYTIQLASYQNKISAEKEGEALKRKGLSPLVMPKGKYTVLCVGNFADKETARSTLSELKKRYQDCFLRRL